jgi:hypothetical protein
MFGLNDHFGTKPASDISSSLEASVQRLSRLPVLSARTDD